MNKVHSNKKRAFNFGFILLFILLAVKCWFLIFSGRIGVHDTLFQFTQQQILLNHYLTYHELPFWMPYLSNGMSLLRFYGFVTSLGPFIMGIFPIFSLLKTLDVLVIHHLGHFFELTVLLIGTSLWSRYHFKNNYIVFFVTTAILGSTIIESQSYYGLYFYYMLPFMFYVGHKLLDTWKLRYVCLLLITIVAQSVAFLAYWIPMLTLIYFAYFLIYISLNYETVKSNFKRDQCIRNLIYAIPVGLVCIVPSVYFFLKGSSLTFFGYNKLRDETGLVSLEVFLDYARESFTGQWLSDFLFQQTFSIDVFLYLGILPVICILFLPFVADKRKSFFFLIMSVFLFLLGSGTFISKCAYYLWPLMKYFRHLYMVNAITKIFIIFTAGFGFQVIAEWKPDKELKKKICELAMPVIIMSMAVFVLIVYPDNVVNSLSLKFSSLMQEEVKVVYQYAEVFKNLAFWIVGILVLFVLIAISPNKRIIKMCLLVLLTMHIIDFGLYQYKEMKVRTYAFDNKIWDQFAAKKYPFQDNRSDTYQYTDEMNYFISQVEKKSVLYWLMDGVFLQDHALHAHRELFMMRPVQEMRDYVKMNDSSKNKLSTNKSFLEAAGVTKPKIQFYDSEPPSDKIIEDEKMLDVMYDVLFFSGNELNLAVNNEYDYPVWMVYSDAWHPDWKVNVNGSNSEVLKANIAYKGVKLNPGQNTVSFRFNEKYGEILFYMQSFVCLIWCLVMLGYFKKEIFSK